MYSYNEHKLLSDDEKFAEAKIIAKNLRQWHNYADNNEYKYIAALNLGAIAPLGVLCGKASKYFGQASDVMENFLTPELLALTGGLVASGIVATLAIKKSNNACWKKYCDALNKQKFLDDLICEFRLGDEKQRDYSYELSLIKKNCSDKEIEQRMSERKAQREKIKIETKVAVKQEDNRSL